MANEVNAVDQAEVEVQSFPNNVIGMILGAIIAGLGLFLIGSPTSGSVTRITGFVLFLIGVAIFAL
ncbi:MAG: hypothetical protein ACM3KR_04800 [Deltaproteobacteria bacterium]